MKSGRTPAVVIGVRSYGESDKIVIFYSRKRGRLSGIAKGAHRSMKRFVNKLELFSHLEILYTESRSSSLVRIDQAELTDPFPLIRANYARFAAASLVSELIFHWTRENDPDPRIFKLLLWTLTSLENLKQPPAWTAILFNIKLLTLLGYKPALTGCAECTSLAPGSGPYLFSPGRNGLLCRGCATPADSAAPEAGPELPFSLRTARLLQKAQELPLGKLDRLRFSPAATKEALAILKIYGNSLLQREISSWDFIVR
ncbi:MAG: DNA repair protein RecO [Desulfurivibrionaceae bacterium]|nr:DNA repair protein RecO [Desulfobulbales bacterium]MDT8335869.1 DNA repair protein RecO [Desulfurivibrionaceae bacterium]